MMNKALRNVSLSSIHPYVMLICTYKHYQLIFALIKREVLGRYKGSFMGVTWSFITPLIMLAIYTFFFSIVFHARWGVDASPNQTNFAIFLFVGLIVHSFFTECINRSSSTITANVNYVKKIVFPLEIIPCVTVGTALFHACISLIALITVQLLLGNKVPWTIIFLPCIFFPIILMSLGVAWFLSATGAYLRDISQVTSLLTAALLFISPVFYPITSLPEKLQKFIFLNPLTLIIEQSRKVVINGTLPDWNALLIYTFFSMIFAWLGFVWFQKLRRGFNDVM